MPDKEPAKNETAIIAASNAQIRYMIYTVRGQQVMLDSNLAELYGVETKVLNQAANRNPQAFPGEILLPHHAERSRRSKVTNCDLTP